MKIKKLHYWVCSVENFRANCPTAIRLHFCQEAGHPWKTAKQNRRRNHASHLLSAPGFVRQNTETDAPTSRVSSTGPRLMRSDEGCQRIACNIKNMKQKGTNWLCSYKSIPTRRNAQSCTITHNPPNLNRLCYDTVMNPASGPTPR